MKAALGLALVLFSAGCLGGSDEPVAADANSPDAADDAVASHDASAPVAPEPAAAFTVPLSWDGNLGTALWICEFQVAQMCVNQVVARYNNELRVEGLSGTLEAVSATLAWDAANPVNEELGFGVMVMTPGCDECNGTSVADVMGASPLSVDASALGIALERPETVVHFYIWNPKLYQWNDNVGVFGSVDDAFTVRGNVTVLP